jgi:two-component system, NtrC family, sensor histidine kinase KinB
MSVVEENLPSVKADPEKTVWVLINLLTNAIRYSPEKERDQH